MSTLVGVTAAQTPDAESKRVAPPNATAVDLQTERTSGVRRQRG